MIKKEKETDNKKVTLDIPKKLYKELHVVIIKQHDSVYGHIREAFIEGLKLWLKIQNANLVQGEAEC